MILLSNLRVLCKHVYRSSSDWISRGSCDWLHCQMLGNGSRSGALEYTDPKGTRLKGSAMHPKSHFNASQYGSLKINLVRLVYSFCFFFFCWVNKCHCYHSIVNRVSMPTQQPGQHWSQRTCECEHELLLVTFLWKFCSEVPSSCYFTSESTPTDLTTRGVECW